MARRDVTMPCRRSFACKRTGLDPDSRPVEQALPRKTGCFMTFQLFPGFRWQTQKHNTNHFSSHFPTLVDFCILTKPHHDQLFLISPEAHILTSIPLPTKSSTQCRRAARPGDNANAAEQTHDRVGQSHGKLELLPKPGNHAVRHHPLLSHSAGSSSPPCVSP